jgi:DNA-binding MarR family transcriptional regulator
MLPFSTATARDAAAFRSALRRFQAATDGAARRARLTPQRYLLLLMIKGAADGSERSTVTDLARSMHLAQTTVTDLVARAERAGLIARRSADHDRRVTHITITADGERRLQATYEALANERAQLQALLRRLDGEAPAPVG